MSKGRWAVIEECPECHDLLVGAEERNGIVRCGACGCLSVVLSERDVRLSRMSKAIR
jgi:hypothetical protein